MRMRRCAGRRLVAAAVSSAMLVVAGPGAAVAHEQRDAGGVRLVVGWGQEPAYTGVMNSVQVTITDAGGAPVTDAGAALEVEVTKGSSSMRLPLEANVGEGEGIPGDYRAQLLPTQPGTYTFRVVGTIRGQPVDESFTSSEATFDDVEDASSVQFPAGDPSTGELATRLEREIPRAVEAGLGQVDDQVDAARTLALVGLVVGALGLLAGAGALVATRRGRLRHRRNG